MDTFIHADIFFFVTTVAVILITALFIVVILYIVRILNDLHYISGVIRKETDVLAEDLETIREKVKNEGILSSFFNMISGLFTGRRERSSDKRIKNHKKKNETK